MIWEKITFGGFSMKEKGLLRAGMVLLLIVMASTGVFASANQEVEEDDGKFSVAMVLVGPINDAGWNESAYKGLILAEKRFGVVTAYSENVPLADFETVFADYAGKGYDLVIGHGFEFVDPAKNVAPDFPNTQFAVVNGVGSQAPNFSSFRFKTYQTGFIAGMVAGLITESNNVGMIGGAKYPHIEAAAENYRVAAQLVNPGCKVQTAYVGNWTDVAKGKEMALAMIDGGADVLTGNANQVTLGIIDAAVSRGIQAIGYIDDQSHVAPDTIFVSAIQSVQNMVAVIVDKAVNGTINPEFYLLGMAEGVIGISDFHGNDSKLSVEDKALIDELLVKIEDGTLEKEGVFWKN